MLHKLRALFVSFSGEVNDLLEGLTVTGEGAGFWPRVPFSATARRQPWRCATETACLASRSLGYGNRLSVRATRVAALLLNSSRGPFRMPGWRGGLLCFAARPARCLLR